jgi:predicted amidophosphoribosyltransferase
MRKIILIDDVCTTGNTLLGLRNDLNEAGFETLAAVTLAYTPLYMRK